MVVSWSFGGAGGGDVPKPDQKRTLWTIVGGILCVMGGFGGGDHNGCTWSAVCQCCPSMDGCLVVEVQGRGCASAMSKGSSTFYVARDQTTSNSFLLC